MMWRSWQTLQVWLQQGGVDTSGWGHGRAKSVAHLWHELQRGETELHLQPPRRMVDLVVLLVWRGEQILLEMGQELADGRFRARAWPPSEKMQKGEHYLDTAVRSLYEELGLTREAYTLHPHSYHTCTQRRDSLSYPTLPADYRFHLLEVEIPHLPHTPFSTAEAEQSTDDAVKRHYWAWAEPPTAVVELLRARDKKR